VIWASKAVSADGRVIGSAEKGGAGARRRIAKAARRLLIGSPTVH
jgi:hypothetical protein